MKARKAYGNSQVKKSILRNQVHGKLPNPDCRDWVQEKSRDDCDKSYHDAMPGNNSFNWRRQYVSDELCKIIR
jgi:hypothetical protein